ncbi:MAG TPA: tRNA lysidine(34) synthetase TilS [Gammaproteobacteria bacterium]|nr:tRNA lysidine(34) synthetase TilS [Gammaproteobacteria bacterium]
MDALLKALRGWCQRLGADRTYWLAYSGGLDSAVLLHLATQLPEFHFKVIHIHHGINPKADDWALHAEAKAKAAGFAFVCERLGLSQTKGESLEAEARERRYQALAKHLQTNEVIFTAHHQDDQAETLLLQLTRGAGLPGLAAMPAQKPFHAGVLVRPLLNANRADLLSVAAQAGLSWVEDDSNLCTNYTRNFLRHHILPTLKARWPSITKTLARSAEHCAETQALLSHLLSQPLKATQGTLPNTLSVSALNAHSPALQKAFIREWVMQAGHEMPSTKKLDTILTTVLTAAWDKSACVSFGEVSVRRHKDNLHLVLNNTPDLNFSREWVLGTPLVLPDQTQLKTEARQGVGFSSRFHTLTVKYRTGGEKIALPGRGRQSLKNLFQTWGVLPWERNGWPLLFDGEVLVGVVGWVYDENYLAKPGEPGLAVIWER